MASRAIEISDDDHTASEVEIIQRNRTKAPPPKRRKLDVDGEDAEEEKVAWTDDSDNETEKVQRLRANRRANKRGRKPKVQGAAGPARKRKDPAEPAADEYAEAEAPIYLRQRKQRFDEDKQLLKDAALKIPPDYGDIYFSDDERLSRLEERPKFDDKSGIKPCRPYKDIELEHSAGVITASIAQYLRDYQITGVRFLHQKFVYQKGCILGDDMGLGKTVQVAAFLTAAFGKTGDERDAKRMRKMRRAGDQWYPRVLIVCPGSLIQNWKNELNRWGWWHVDLYHGPGREDVLQAAKAGRIEIMITTYVTYKKSFEAVNTIEWDCVVADECHTMKDRRSEVTRTMDQINSLCRIGLTGTAIQNKYEELWTLLNWTNPGHFGTLAEWYNTITKPLTVGQSHDATLKQLSIARITAKKLVQNLLPEFFLRRMKTLIADQLPKKSDKVVFCPLTQIQQEAYSNFLAGPQVSIINSVSDPCECNSGIKRGWCCHKYLPSDDPQIKKPWMSIVFPTIVTLQKLANHLTLLIPSSSDPSEKQKSGLATLETCVPSEWESLYLNRDSMLNLSNPEFCGKWKVLKKLLRFWHENGDKVLVFSHSVRLLRILQHLFHNTSYNVSFLDGSLSYVDRQQVVDDFNSDPAQFVFLISTKAGGVGLNITSANKVVIFDPHWNPSYDLQAQDRAYRIGQVRDVDVFRLVSAGTIEEIVYARQIYKQQQANIGYNASNERRYFKGVQQDKSRKGEIFGLSNLFAFERDQVVLREIVNKTNVAEARAGVHLADLETEGLEGDDEHVKQEEDGGGEDDEVGGMSRLAKILTSEDQEGAVSAVIGAGASKKKPKSDAVAAILASAGVEYTHENSEVIGTSKVEAQLSKKAELAAVLNSAGSQGIDQTLFGPSDEELDDDDEEEEDISDSADEGGEEDENDGHGSESGRKKGRKNKKKKGMIMHYRFRPPEQVMRRQFCSMAKEFGFSSVTDFALVVESWTQEQRRNCLDAFYRAREVKLLEKEIEKIVNKDKKIKALRGVGVNNPAIKRETGSPAVSTSVVGGDKEKVKAENGTANGNDKAEANKKRTSLIFLDDDDDDEEDDEL
ncbi:switch 2 [Rhypophila decipiens]